LGFDDGYDGGIPRWLGGSVTKVYARVFRHCSSMIDAVRRRFG
jgi:hypothetical protein